MKEVAMKAISNYLIKEDLSKFSNSNHFKLFEKFKKEVKTNIETNNSFSDVLIYLMDTRFYFNEIKKGYYKNINVQLELFPYENKRSKKNYLGNVIIE